MPELSENVLEIRDLKTYFYGEEGELPAVDGVSISVKRGKVLALVGESGCGKSVTSFSVLRLIQEPGKIAGGRILLHSRDGQTIDITALDRRSELLYKVRGGLISMIFQEPMTALSPVHSIGNQICEAILLHQKASKAEAEAQAIEMLARVGIPNPDRRMRQYPHELSGGMRQRVIIAMALACKPELLIADEPTTALDVTIQAQVLAVIKQLQAELGTSVLFVTHDLGVVAQMADDVAVMYLGRIVEEGTVRQVLKDPLHPYTQALLKSLPGLGKPGEELPSIAGSVPFLTEIPAGCPFHPRCRHAQQGRCDIGSPPRLREIKDAHSVACIRAEEITDQ